ncbi:hypothetical protein [Phenylobacterium sp.]|nr:hypothetical protein [Phenylobacterium sp.]
MATPDVSLASPLRNPTSPAGRGVQAVGSREKATTPFAIGRA